jgi:hypothetical protein
MTTLEGRPNTALLVTGTQNAILAAADGRDGVNGEPVLRDLAITRLGALVERRCPLLLVTLARTT